MSSVVNEWVKREFESLKFKSKRLVERFLVTMTMLFEHPDKSIWLAAGSRSNAKAIYRMLANDNLARENILSAHHDAVETRFESGVLLAVQDTMSANYGTHEKTEGLGYCCDQTLGINVHSCLFVTPEGIPIGLAAQSYITRDRESTEEALTHDQKRRRPIEEKESYRWLETMDEASVNAPPNAQLIHIADREGDIYELYALAQETKEKFVIRATYSRLDVDGSHTIKSLRTSEPIGRIKTTIPANPAKGTKEREALLSIQVRTFDIKKPSYRNKDLNLAGSLSLTMIRVWELHPPDGAEPLEWLLMTNLPIDTVQDVMKVVNYYKQRWKIERFHYVLKSGCNIEGIQQRSVRGIELMILFYSFISIQIMMLTFLSRSYPDMSCDLVFSETEWKTLFRAANKTRQAPDQPYSMADAVKFVARLGGFDGAPSDGPPGLKVIWIGIMSLFILCAYREFV